FLSGLAPAPRLQRCEARIRWLLALHTVEDALVTYRALAAFLLATRVGTLAGYIAGQTLRCRLRLCSSADRHDERSNSAGSKKALAAEQRYACEHRPSPCSAPQPATWGQSWVDTLQSLNLSAQQEAG